MKIPLIEQFNKKIGLDLGSSRTRVWVAGLGVVADVPTCIAFDKKNKNVLAIGEEAEEMDGRVGDHIMVSHPVVNGRVYDANSMTTFLKILINKSIGSIALYNPVIMASVPVGATQADKEITTQVLYALGAGEAYTIVQPLAASIGAGVPIADASGSFVLNLGSGIVECVIISLGSVIVFQSSEYAGDYFANSIRLYAQKHLDLKISKKTADILKHDVVSLEYNSDREKLIAGQDTVDESPKELLVKSRDIFSNTIDYLDKVDELVVTLLSKTPPELAVDVIDKGLIITGGLAKIHGIELYFVEKLGIPVSVVDNSANAVIEGIGQTLENLDLFRKSLGYQE
jgi:rod shape-determining protein MreB and related proteins